MSITINLPADVEAKIRAAARKSGESIEGFAERLLVREATEEGREELAVILAGAPNTRFVKARWSMRQTQRPPRGSPTFSRACLLRTAQTAFTAFGQRLTFP